MDSILNELGINDINSGACTGHEKWSQSDNADTLISYNPTNGEKIASVSMADSEDFDRVLNESTKSFEELTKSHSSGFLGDFLQLKVMSEKIIKHEKILNIIINIFS